MCSTGKKIRLENRSSRSQSKHCKWLCKYISWCFLIETLNSVWTGTLMICSQEKAMATHSGTLAWKIPWTEEPGRLQSMGSLKGWTRLSDFTFMHWRRKWQPTPVFLPGESQGWGSLVGFRLWGCTESDTTEAT